MDGPFSLETSAKNERYWSVSAGRWKPRFLPLTAARRKRVCLEDLTSREGKITLMTKSSLEETVSISKSLSCLELI